MNDSSNALRQSPTRQEVGPSNPKDSRQAVDFVTARTMREAFKAKMAKIEYEEKADKLTDATKVRDDAFRAGRMVRDALLGIPDRLFDVLAAEKDPVVVRTRLLEELESVLNKLTDQ